MVIARNLVNVDCRVSQYVETINRLHIEGAKLKEKLTGKRDQQRDTQRREVLEEVEKAKCRLPHRQASCTGGEAQGHPRTPG
ncbi:hypothetical protein GSI_12591 [Ganoderma sinense ZZ0214-1]|uniref:Uncharacterized protein n=1 Tax=Ganoderma sinense ZZ0214-1 TaxID=1077348 RepID=A0A2G8RT67_9APHY|nr:hypothetical protein GSI_12591 [Ganoderma sinense ZZ0214-1]